MSGYDGVPEAMPDRSINDWCKRLAIKCNQLLRGRQNVTYNVTLAPNVGSTVVNLPPDTLSDTCYIGLMATTANAASANAYVSAVDVANNQFTITHVNNANADKSFRILIIG